MKKIIEGSLTIEGLVCNLFGIGLDGSTHYLGTLGSDFDMRFDDETDEWVQEYIDPNKFYDLAEEFEFELIDLKSKIPNPLIYVVTHRFNDGSFYTVFSRLNGEKRYVYPEHKSNSHAFSRLRRLVKAKQIGMSMFLKYQEIYDDN